MAAIKCYDGDEELFKIENKFKFAGTVHQANDSLIHQTVKTAIRQYKLENERKRHCDVADDHKPSKKRRISLHKGYQIIEKKTAETFDSFDFSPFQNVQHVEAYKQCDDAEYLAEEEEEEEEEEAYEEDDNEDCENNWRNDYPDESSWFYNADPNFSCYDCVQPKSKQAIEQHLLSNISIHTTELQAINFALEFIKSKINKSLLVITDSLSSALAITQVMIGHTNITYNCLLSKTDPPVCKYC
ncbi:hypothetical protein HELRODRAFT_166955 [Helobdella robusta]|uniref:Probable RNA polymerase II nuclear localization protein SLC7A6OS n=1 Tax=Helobdella robusta TaxID=6412 RepID=T1EYT1_HELRO|nr:hypothetical protein HELRODRAFT_166955 [Helobdella robusta]ESO11874.1 hypothetical protein HELRODRAFT_166955 [Helobdella robusta]